MELVLEGVKVVTPREVIEDVNLGIEAGIIATISSEPLMARRVLRLRGCYVIPGLVELHSDAIEKEIEPRPGVRFPYEVALCELDKRMASCGITTVLHAISFAEGELGLRSVSEAVKLIELIVTLRSKLLSRNFIHLRFELTNIDAVKIAEKLIKEKKINLFSFMDHTPGQGQFRSDEAYVEYLMKTYSMKEEEAREIIRRKKELKDISERVIKEIAHICNIYEVPMASHDDDSEEKVKLMKGFGIILCEFPVNLSTATFAANNGLFVCLGAPNVIRGTSHSGNLRAIEAIEAGVCHILSSDYLPWTLYQAPFYLYKRGLLSLPSAVNLVSYNPARVIGLEDMIGSVEPGKKADLVVIKMEERIPQVIMTIREGKVIYFREL